MADNKKTEYKKVRAKLCKGFVSVFSLTSKALKILKKEGIIVFLKYAYKYFRYGRNYFSSGESIEQSYEKWIVKNEKFDEIVIKKEIANFKYNPKVSIITPVYNIDPKWLNKCVKSVLAQFYDNWELCLHDDASTNEDTIKCLQKWEKFGDSRIKISYGKDNQHISGASNSALAIAEGEFVALLDNDDELAPNALFEAIKLINSCHDDVDFIYSDEDRLDGEGKRVMPFFKPDWSLDLFLSMMYTCHLSIFRKRIVDEIGGFRKGYEGSQDYDLVLRFIEKIDQKNIKHISKILYHWRTIETSVSGNSNAKSYAFDAAKKALKDYLQRNDIEGEVLDGCALSRYRIKRRINNPKKVSIIIPFRDQVEVLKKCVKSIKSKTTYQNYELILVNNESVEEKTKTYLKEFKSSKDVLVLNYDKPFNFSAINNFAVKHAQGDYILFLNNDTEVISPEWLESMVEHIQRPEIGIVGAKLLYPNNTIQHAGVIMGIGIAGHAFKHLPKDSLGYFEMASLIRNYSAVTGACLLIKKALFEKVGDFNEEELAVAYNDIDLCLKVKEEGFLVVYTPYAVLYHYEYLSRGNDELLRFMNRKKYKRVLAEREYMQNKWKKYIENDPYYNVNLTRKSENFSLNI